MKIGYNVDGIYIHLLSKLELPRTIPSTSFIHFFFFFGQNNAHVIIPLKNPFVFCQNYLMTPTKHRYDNGIIKNFFYYLISHLLNKMSNNISSTAEQTATRTCSTCRRTFNPTTTHKTCDSCRVKTSSVQ